MAPKRKRATADDLLRLQEQANSLPKRKRPQGSWSAEESDYEERDSELEEQSSGSDSHQSEPEENIQLPSPDGLSRLERISLRNAEFDNVPPIAGPSSFGALNISPPLISALAAMSIRHPTEIQSACIPPLLAGWDCIGNAKTGSGKTIAFALPILQALSRDPYGIYALVLTPTRELAFQIAEQFSVLGLSFGVRTSTVVGGMDMISQALELKEKPHVVVATPGRLVDHLKSTQGEIDLSKVKFLVLDEADRLLTTSFAPELAHIFSVIPPQRQTALFTATLTPAVEKLAEAPPRPGKERPFIHRMTEQIETVSTLKQFYILAPSHMREMYLYYLLTHPPESITHLRRAPPEPQWKKKGKQKAKESTSITTDEIQQPPPTIIFTPTARLASYLSLLLQNMKIRSTAMHSRLSQKQRLQSLALFRSFVIPVLVTTDVGARGLDVADVALVVSWDIPQEPETYTHRVGRTARAGKGGIAVAFIGGEEDGTKLGKVEERISTRLEEMTFSESKMLEHLNAVSTAKRLANMELHDSDFGKREEIHKIKKRKRERDLERTNVANAEISQASIFKGAAIS